MQAAKAIRTRSGVPEAMDILSACATRAKQAVEATHSRQALPGKASSSSLLGGASAGQIANLAVDLALAARPNPAKAEATAGASSGAALSSHASASALATEAAADLLRALAEAPISSWRGPDENDMCASAAVASSIVASRAAANSTSLGDRMRKQVLDVAARTIARTCFVFGSQSAGLANDLDAFVPTDDICGDSERACLLVGRFNAELSRSAAQNLVRAQQVPNAPAKQAHGRGRDEDGWMDPNRHPECIRARGWNR